MELTKCERLHFFYAWKGWLSIYFPTVQPNLQFIPCKNQLDLLAAFMYYVRQGGISQRQQHVHVQTVLVALRSISTQLQLDGEQNPVVDVEGKYPKAISQILEGFRRNNPPTQP